MQARPIVTRQAGIADLEDLVPLFDGYRVFYGQASDPQRAREFLAERFANLQSVVFIAFSDDRPAGFVQLYPTFSSVHCARVLTLNDLFVAPANRREGIARSLLDAACEHARNVGALRLTLITQTQNGAARALYESAGWIPDTVFRTYHYQVDG